MSNNNPYFNVDNYSNDDTSLNYEFSLISYEQVNTSRFPRPPRPGGYIPPTHLQPGGSGATPPPFTGVYPPPPTIPGSIPISGPPNYIPSKKDKGVTFLNNPDEEVSLKSISANSISFCLYQYTYIWETNGRSYWSYLINVDPVSVSGFMWLGLSWLYFGVDLTKIDSFVCYREDTCNCTQTRNIDNMIESIKEEYLGDEIKEVYSKTLVSVDIPEYKNDFLVETIGIIDDKKIQSKIPCVKDRVISYRINLELSYPSTLDEVTKSRLIDFANEASIEVLSYMSNGSLRKKNSPLNVLEIFDSYVASINKLLNVFSTTFNKSLQKLSNWREISKYINIKIVKEKITTKWKYK